MREPRRVSGRVVVAHVDNGERTTALAAIIRLFTPGREKPNDGGQGRGALPVINVSYDDATTYTAWLTQQTGSIYRLPTESEWEYAARAQSTEARYWGDASGCEYANAAAFAYSQPLASPQ